MESDIDLRKGNEAISYDGNHIIVDLESVVILLRSGTERSIMLKFVSRLTSRHTRSEDAKRKGSNEWYEVKVEILIEGGHVELYGNTVSES